MGLLFLCLNKVSTDFILNMLQTVSLCFLFGIFVTHQLPQPEEGQASVESPDFTDYDKEEVNREPAEDGVTLDDGTKDTSGLVEEQKGIDYDCTHDWHCFGNMVCGKDGWCADPSGNGI